jgi:hypothetical protein
MGGPISGRECIAVSVFSTNCKLFEAGEKPFTTAAATMTSAIYWIIIGQFLGQEFYVNYCIYSSQLPNSAHHIDKETGLKD